LEIGGAYLLVHDVPYVNASKEIKIGTLVSSLTLSSERTSRPDNHVIHFIGGRNQMEKADWVLS
jgi:hypothetical protein